MPRKCHHALKDCTSSPWLYSRTASGGPAPALEHFVPPACNVAPHPGSACCRTASPDHGMGSDPPLLKPMFRIMSEAEHLWSLPICVLCLRLPCTVWLYRPYHIPTLTMRLSHVASTSLTVFPIVLLQWKILSFYIFSFISLLKYLKILYIRIFIFLVKMYLAPFRGRNMFIHCGVCVSSCW